jgi:hypothetical protein
MQGFITAIYRDVFGLAADAGGQAYWLNLATNGTMMGSSGVGSFRSNSAAHAVRGFSVAERHVGERQTLPSRQSRRAGGPRPKNPAAA